MQFRRGFFVALLVIVCGALLVTGGAISLLMGFDIVMTERGSAMTLGGVIALSGGVIAVGIGFALLRLSQILAALLERNKRGGRPVVTPDRPVMPLAVHDSPAPADVPPPLVGEPGVSRVGIGAGVAAAGLAASAAAYSSLPAAARVMEPDASPDQERAVSTGGYDDAPGMPGRPDLDAVQVTDALPAQRESIPDLEEELARALAEPEVLSAPVPAREKSFAEGLNDLLAKPKERKSAQDTDVLQDTGALQEAETETLPETSALPAFVETISAGQELMDDSIDAAPVDAPPGDGVAVPGIVEVAGPEMARALAEPVANDLIVARPSAPAPAARKVLGTYNAGGRTYSMYADGSVEAATESGIERFSSMDELRHHLVRG
jgi:hypothetical protein